MCRCQFQATFLPLKRDTTQFALWALSGIFAFIPLLLAAVLACRRNWSGGDLWFLSQGSATVYPGKSARAHRELEKSQRRNANGIFCSCDIHTSIYQAQKARRRSRLLGGFAYCFWIDTPSRAHTHILRAASGTAAFHYPSTAQLTHRESNFAGLRVREFARPQSS